MNVELQPAAIQDKPVLRQLMELYNHDFSEFDGTDVDEHGIYGYYYLDHYWTEPERSPFLIRVDGRLAGFVLVRLLNEPEKPPTHAIAEFFVMRKYRRQGVGRLAARLVFDRFPGTWQVCQEEANLPAQRFWRQVVAEYTRDNYDEVMVEGGHWRGPCQEFDNQARE